MKKITCVVLTIILALSVCAIFAACNQIADNTEYYDSITKTLELTKSYEGKSFLTDGIGSATLDGLTDGDTTRFKLASGETVSVRYQCIDTPESTGGVEKWGKAASLFSKQQLSVPGTEFVLEATTTPASHDNYGTRYLGYVWYKHPGEDFKCMNLEMVENGFSENKAINTSEFPYYSYFKEANDFAQKIKLRIYSDLDDPLYSTDPVDLTLKQLYDNIDEYYNAETDSGAKIRIYATLSDIYVSKTDTHTYTALQYDEATGKTYEIKVYAGYSSSAASSMELGNLCRIVGTVQKHNGDFQISGIIYDSIYGDRNPEYTNPTQRGYYLTFDGSKSFDGTYYRRNLFTNVTVVSSSVEGTTLTIIGTAKQVTKDGLGDEQTFTFKVPVNENYNNVFTAGKIFSAQGFQFVENSKEIKIISYSDIKLK